MLPVRLRAMVSPFGWGGQHPALSLLAFGRSSSFSSREAGYRPPSDGAQFALSLAVDKNKLIAVRHVKAGNRVIPVELFRNEGGSVAARCIIADADMPIIDGATADEAMATVEDALEGLLFARAGAP
jgi:hypothetical protein